MYICSLADLSPAKHGAQSLSISIGDRGTIDTHVVVFQYLHDNMHQLSSVTYDIPANMEGKQLVDLLRLLPATVVYLSLLSHHSSTIRVSDIASVALPSLRELVLETTIDTTDFVISGLFAQLEGLALTHTTISATDALQLLQKTPQLKSLELVDTLIHQLGSHREMLPDLPQLRTIGVLYHGGIQRQEYRNSLYALAKFPQIQELLITATPHEEGYFQFALPLQVAEMTNLKKLHLTGAKAVFNGVESTVRKLVNLEKLRLPLPYGAVLPDFSHNPRLRILDLSHPEPTSLPYMCRPAWNNGNGALLGLATSVTTLDLSFQPHLDQLPEAMSKLVNLRILSLARNPQLDLESLAVLKHLPCLMHLTLAGHVHEIPSQRCQDLSETLFDGGFKELRHLNIRWCGMHQLPSTITKLPCLQELVADINYFRTMPLGFWNMNTLRTLVLHGNKRLQVPANVTRDLHNLMLFTQHTELFRAPPPLLDITAKFIANHRTLFSFDNLPQEVVTAVTTTDLQRPLLEITGTFFANHRELFLVDHLPPELVAAVTTTDLPQYKVNPDEFYDLLSHSATDYDSEDERERVANGRPATDYSRYFNGDMTEDDELGGPVEFTQWG